MIEADTHPKTAERRALERMPTMLRGKAFPGPVDCVVKDFTERGARLHFDGPPPTDENLIMVVWTSGMAFEAQVRWRSGNDLGVLFLQRCDFRARTPARFWPARQLWLKSRRPLRRSALKAQSAMIVDSPRRKGRGFG